MTNEAVLITGASGEIGYSLIEHLIGAEQLEIVTLDLKPLNNPAGVCHYQADMLDAATLKTIFDNHNIQHVFHLAALLSSAGERDPFRAHRVNVEATVSLMRQCCASSSSMDSPIRFVFPSSIAVYGVSSSQRAHPVREDESLHPQTMYGLNKFSIEGVGRYLSSPSIAARGRLDFRSLRFPGLLSADSLPSGGTTDFASEMIHAACQQQPYECYISPHITLPFLTMPDAIHALINLWHQEEPTLTARIFNVFGFSLSPRDVETLLAEHSLNPRISYQVDRKRENITLAWPEALDDSLARKVWGWLPTLNKLAAFQEYLIPTIQKRYQSSLSPSNTL